MNSSLHIGGLFAVGFDNQVKYLLTVSHSGRGLYDLSSMKMLARDRTVVYPKNNQMLGIGPISDLMINILEKDYKTESLQGQSPDKKYSFNYDDGQLVITDCA